MNITVVDRGGGGGAELILSTAEQNEKACYGSRRESQAKETQTKTETEARPAGTKQAGAQRAPDTRATKTETTQDQDHTEASSKSTHCVETLHRFNWMSGFYGVPPNGKK